MRKYEKNTQEAFTYRADVYLTLIGMKEQRPKSYMAAIETLSDHLVNFI